MGLAKMSAEAVAARAINQLGLDESSLDLLSVEVAAASLRRAASFMCPASPAQIVDAVLSAIRPVAAADVARDELVQVLEQLVASGDLLELREASRRSTRLLYLAPPSYIERHPGNFILMGVRPFGAPLLHDDLSELIQHEGHTRLLALDPSEGAKQLASRDLRPLTKERWVASPAVENPESVLSRYRQRLDEAPTAGLLDSLIVLDHAKSVRYYRGRWRSVAQTDAGDFLARRPQAYGADLWCLVRLQAGAAQQFLELPCEDALLPGRDEAWRYQAAADASRGNAQRFRVRDLTPGNESIFDFFSPLPGFAERYMQVVGMTLGKTQGSLFSFRVPSAARATTAEFVRQQLWMTLEEAMDGV